MISCITHPLSFPHCARISILILLLGLFIPVQAAQLVKPDALSLSQAKFKRLEQQIASAQTATAEELKTLKSEIGTVRDSAMDCVKEVQPKLDMLDDELGVLQLKKPGATKSNSAATNPSAGQLEPALPPALARQLQDLQSRKASLEGSIAICKLMLLSSSDLESKVDGYLSNLQTRFLLTRGPNLVSVIQANLERPERWLEFADQLVAVFTSWHPAHRVDLAGIGVFGLLGLALGFILFRTGRHRIKAWTDGTSIEEEGISVGLVQAVLASAVNYAPILLALASGMGYVTFITHINSDPPFMVTILLILLTYFAIAAVVRALLDPCPPASPYLPVPADIAIPLSHRSRILVAVALSRWLMLEFHADGLLDDDMYALLRQIVGWVFVLNVIWIVWLLRRIQGWGDKWTLPLIISLALLSGGVVAGIGYMNLGALVIVGITNTLTLLGLALVLSQFFSDIFDGLDQGRYRWQKAARRAIGLKGEDYVPGLGWLRLVLNLALWICAALLMLRIWDADEQFTANIIGYFTEGFQVGGLTIVPANLFWAILIFAVLLSFTGWFKKKLDRKWLVKTHMETSAREALVTTFGYFGAGIAVIVALLFAGINFAHVAIFAGALSVGLGFGLQNIVNNFVSGIIMLAERPVRKGDWIVVGNTEGYVQRISIRTTTIRTFDRADVIVPNSDLISGQVTNWTLGNTWGRIKVPIGVAYGSDIELVIKTMLEAANNNSEVVKGNPLLPDPNVLFLRFGDSSLDFEMRAMVRNVNQCMQVISDLNRAINAEFNKLGIEIPFPQRDINFRGPLHTEQDSKMPPESTGGGDLTES